MDFMKPKDTFGGRLVDRKSFKLMEEKPTSDKIIKYN
jgi:hypothetical protein